MQRIASPDPTTPPTWRVWKAQNAGRRWYWRYPLAVEWALEWFVYRLRGLALFDLLELAGKLTILVAVIFWFLEGDDRAKEGSRHRTGRIARFAEQTGDVPRVRRHLRCFDCV